MATNNTTTDSSPSYYVPEASLIDKFAMAALTGGLEQGLENDMGSRWWHSPNKIAERAYEIAQAMMEVSGHQDVIDVECAERQAQRAAKAKAVQ